jgi:hypothetical protein
MEAELARVTLANIDQEVRPVCLHTN